MATNFDNVHLSSVKENSEITPLFKDAVQIGLCSESFNTCINVYNGRTELQTIVLSKDVETAKVGENTAIVSSDGQSTMIKFASPKDRISFLFQLKEMVSNQKKSVFTERTEDASAEQYFQFYGYLSQQQNMMQDYIRTSTYQRAMLDNTLDFQDKVVLDVGAGSGILSFFAAQAGAKRVYAIEASSMAIHCESLVKNNKLGDTIKVIAGKIEELDLPEQVDIIISEPMGYMLFNERMLETYLHAKKWLKPGGKMFPSQGDLHIAPFTDDSLYMEQFSKANFWYQPSFHGVDLSGLREAAVKEYFKQPVVDTFDIRTCLARSQKYVVDFGTAHESDLHVLDIPVTFTMLQSGSVHGLAFWFDVAFIGSQSTVWLSTAPTQPLTHWYQVRCLLQNPVFVKQGQVLTGRVVLKANKRQSYDVELELTIPGTNTKSTNTLDLKNPFFRYTGQQPAAPPGTNSTSPSDAYWTQDPTGAEVQNYGVATIVNGGMGDASILLQQQQQPVAAAGSVAAAPVNPGSIPAATIVSVNNAANLAMQTRTSVGGGIAPFLFNATSSNSVSSPSSVGSQHQPQPAVGGGGGGGSGSSGVPASAQPFSVSHQFMIGDYVCPNNQMNLPTQGLAANFNKPANM